MKNPINELLNRIQIIKNKIKRYHPFLEWTQHEVDLLIKFFNLPTHPLQDQGDTSIGCEPCTNKPLDNCYKSGRWKDIDKDECGLHTLFR